MGKAYFGFTDEELLKLDKFVRDHTVERFGPHQPIRWDKPARDADTLPQLEKILAQERI